MAFNRKSAVDYADKYWNIPADDGIFWLTNQSVSIDQVRQRNVIGNATWKKAAVADGWQPFFVNDNSGGEKAVFRRVVAGKTEEILINSWEGIADCAHFLSRCLTAGGLQVEERGVPSLVRTLQARSDTKTLCEQVPTSAAQRVIDTGIIKPGDMIGYFNVDPKGDYGGAKQYAHSTMYVGKVNGNKDGGITCHTICRFPGRSWVEDSWWLKPPGHYAYTLIHFSADDPAPNLSQVNGLTGWWQLNYAGRTEYYLIEKSGSATYTKIAPKKGQLFVTAPQGSAYWFMAASGEITFVWRKTATVEVWARVAAGYKSLINGVTPGTLKKIS
jgi:hypothetical protein